jgi:hypothetical protein
MKLQKKITRIVALAAIALCVAAVHAQDQREDPRSVNPISPLSSANSGGNNEFGKIPVPAARGLYSAFDAQAYDPAQVDPDTNTLSGAEVFSVGSLQHSRNVFDPSLTISSLGQTGGLGIIAPAQAGPRSNSMIGGTLNFNRIWNRYHLAASYNGGENIYSGYLPNSSFHNGSFSQDVEWQRWRLRLRDDFTAAPGAAFTGGGMGGPGLLGEFSSTLGASLNTINQKFLPSESIQTGPAKRYRNTALGQVEYSFSRRSAFTFSGSYGLLHFTDAGYVSSHMLNAQAGYDYLMDPKNSIAVLATYGKIDYTGTMTSTADYTAELAYGRKITGRLAFQAAAGPEQIRATGSGNGNFRLLEGAVNSALKYELRRSGFSLAYTRGLTGGSGVFFGATADTITGSLHHQFSRFWSGSSHSGYAFNRSFVPAGLATSSFHNWFVGANVDRQLGRHAQVGFSYAVDEQTSPAICPVASCGGTGFQQTFGMTLNWHLLPVE